MNSIPPFLEALIPMKRLDCIPPSYFAIGFTQEEGIRHIHYASPSFDTPEEALNWAAQKIEESGREDMKFWVTLNI